MSPLPPLLLLLSLLSLTKTLMVQGFMVASSPVAPALLLMPHRLGKKLTTKYSLYSSFSSSNDDSFTDDILDDYDRARKVFDELLLKDHNKLLQKDQQHNSATNSHHYFDSYYYHHNLDQLLLISSNDGKNSNFDNLRYSQQRPLTATAYTRRQLEIRLLQSLQDSDGAIDELMNLWLQERDYESAQQLQQMTQECSPGLVQEAQTLKQMLLEHGPEWVEPMSRLAAVLYYQGNTQQAKQWCQVALIMKPWHFEVGHTAVLLSLRQQEPTSETLKLSRRYTLPCLNPRTNNKRRKEWVNWAVQQAKQSLQYAIQITNEYHTDESECPVDEQPCWQ